MKHRNRTTRPRRVRRDTSKVRLLSELYANLHADTESFERDKIGADLAYLAGAVIKGTRCEWPANRPIVRSLQEHYGKRHRLWRHVKVTGAECRKCGNPIVGGFCEDETCPFRRHVQTCPQPLADEANPAAPANLKECHCHLRIIARFIPQHDENTHRMISDVVDDETGEVRFDVTDEILAMGRQKALKIEDDRDSSDALLPQEVRGTHDGPFRVVVQDAIREFFERWDSAEQWWDDSTLDAREAAGFKRILPASRLEVWFDDLTQAEQAAVVEHLQGQIQSSVSAE
ncbi:MAG TPA: hypothetical protein VMP11_10650 [Verrucomicrobiae bacterium]|nr:hypothetical protein [Verrucomicrobiae bacterium]